MTCFFRKNYLGVLQYINKLDTRNNDFKVAHNKALVEYYKSDLRKNDTFHKNLNSICTQVSTTFTLRQKLQSYTRFSTKLR